MELFGAGTGGGVFAFASAVSLLDGSSARSNSAQRGGGLFVAGNASAVELEGSALSGNTATLGGGGAFLEGVAAFASRAAAFEGNEAAEDGAGVYFGGVRSADISTTTFSSNRAGGRGASFFVDPACGPVALRDSVLANNSATAGAGAFFQAGTAQARLSGTNVASGNRALLWGVGVAATAVSEVRVALRGDGGAIPSGGEILAAVTLFDGFGSPVEAIPGATLALAASAPGALSGKLTGFYSSSNDTLPGVRLAGAEGVYTLNFTVSVDSGPSVHLRAPLSATLNVRIGSCGLSEMFDSATQARVVACCCTAQPLLLGKGRQLQLRRDPVWSHFVLLRDAVMVCVPTTPVCFAQSCICGVNSERSVDGVCVCVAPLTPA